jgi:ankyrin repeat protein
MEVIENAIESDNLEKLKILIHDFPINDLTESGETFLTLAAAFSTSEIVEFLVSNGADLNKKNAENKTPLYRAIINQKIDNALLLISLGANLESKDYNYVDLTLNDDNVKIFEKLIEKTNKINYRNDSGMTYLMLAASMSSIEILKFLLDKINLNLQSNDGKTALMYSVKLDTKKNQESCRLLLLHGADINIQDKKGRTALIHAVKNICLENVKILLSNPDCNVNIVDKNYMTAIMYTFTDYDNSILEKISKLLLNKHAIVVNDPMYDAYINKYDNFPILFQNALETSADELRWTIERNVMDNESVLMTMIQRKDWKNLKLLLQKNFKLELHTKVEFGQLYEILKNVNPTIFGRLVKPIKYTDLPRDGIVKPEVNFPNNFTKTFNPTVLPGSPAEKVWLLQKANEQLESWKEEHGKYLENSRNRSIVRSYTYHGDRLLNFYLRGQTSFIYGLLEVIKKSKAEENPLAVQIYEMYDDFLGRGFILPEKTLLYNSDGYNFDLLHKIFLTNYDRIKQKSVLFSLIERFRRDLNNIIKKAPRMIEPFNVYRGTKQDTLLESGAYLYVTNSYSSTSLVPNIAGIFTQPHWYGTNLFGIILEIEITSDIPCLYVKSISKFPHEEEVLLSPNLKIQALPESNIMYLYDFSQPYYVRHLKVIGYGSLKNNVLRYTIKNSKNKKINSKPKIKINNTYTKKNRNNY